MDRMAGLTFEGERQAARGGSQGEKCHSSILLLLPDLNWTGPTCSQRVKKACGTDHRCHHVGGGRVESRPAGTRQHGRQGAWGSISLPAATQVLSFINSHLTISENGLYLTVDGGSALWKCSIQYFFFFNK